MQSKVPTSPTSDEVCPASGGNAPAHTAQKHVQKSYYCILPGTRVPILQCGQCPLRFGTEHRIYMILKADQGPLHVMCLHLVIIMFIQNLSKHGQSCDSH